jgi:hypothetical protein
VTFNRITFSRITLRRIFSLMTPSRMTFRRKILCIIFNRMTLRKVAKMPITQQLLKLEKNKRRFRILRNLENILMYV